MTEAEWLASTDPFALLQRTERVSQRKGKLFVVGCYRQHDPELRNRLDREAILAVEGNADGLVSDEELYANRGRGKVGYRIATACSATPPVPMFVILATGLIKDRQREQAIQCELIRDIFGNPFRPVAVDPSWRTSTVVALAQQMYESRDFAPMPVLADALQDAGCDNEDVLAHCRGAGPHVRGCWVVDLILGKS
jgi:hypothetical protein